MHDQSFNPLTLFENSQNDERNGSHIREIREELTGVNRNLRAPGPNTSPPRRHRHVTLSALSTGGSRPASSPTFLEGNRTTT